MKNKLSFLTIALMLVIQGAATMAQAKSKPSEGNVMVRVATSKLIATLPAATDFNSGSVVEYGAYFQDSGYVGFATVTPQDADGSLVLSKGKNIIANGKNKVQVDAVNFTVSAVGFISNFVHITIIKDGVVYKDQIVRGMNSYDDFVYYSCSSAEQACQ